MGQLRCVTVLLNTSIGEISMEKELDLLFWLFQITTTLWNLFSFLLTFPKRLLHWFQCSTCSLMCPNSVYKISFYNQWEGAHAYNGTGSFVSLIWYSQTIKMQIETHFLAELKSPIIITLPFTWAIGTLVFSSATMFWTLKQFFFLRYNQLFQ